MSMKALPLLWCGAKFDSLLVWYELMTIYSSLFFKEKEEYLHSMPKLGSSLSYKRKKKAYTYFVPQECTITVFAS